MSQYQWGAQRQHANPAYNNPAYQPGQSQPYAPPQPPVYNQNEKSPYEGDRFKHKKRINDPLPLILFILQVRRLLPTPRRAADRRTVCRLLCGVRAGFVDLDLAGRAGRWLGQWQHRDVCDAEQVRRRRHQRRGSRGLNPGGQTYHLPAAFRSRCRPLPVDCVPHSRAHVHALDHARHARPHYPVEHVRVSSPTS
ncbi:hypothetical protein FA95DRAFT_140853 [Auriscalpium vulgare]|uniref:Uncharacterized protein n=1 Tax=Auriscalpium vulgare TaxID=40419 RepID=A0ACB8S5T3_9AGAM|nr:hypothetical protein FA95DRAFT_140853 [Auriscalpium vulgare]